MKGVVEGGEAAALTASGAAVSAREAAVSTSATTRSPPRLSKEYLRRKAIQFEQVRRYESAVHPLHLHASNIMRHRHYYTYACTHASFLALSTHTTHSSIPSPSLSHSLVRAHQDAEYVQSMASTALCVMGEVEMREQRESKGSSMKQVSRGISINRWDK